MVVRASVCGIDISVIEDAEEAYLAATTVIKDGSEERIVSVTVCLFGPPLFGYDLIAHNDAQKRLFNFGKVVGFFSTDEERKFKIRTDKMSPDQFVTAQYHSAINRGY